MNIEQAKKKSGARFFCSCVGRTSLTQDNPLYQEAKQLAKVIIKLGGGVIHGGYKDETGGGTMQAFAQGADEQISEQGLRPELNINVLHSEFTQKQGTRSHCDVGVFLDPVESIDEMAKIITDSCDVMLVFSHVGSGTLHEVATRLCKNDLYELHGVGKGSVPIIFYGKKRKELLAWYDQNLALGRKFLEAPEVYCKESIEECEQILQKICQSL